MSLKTVVLPIPVISATCEGRYPKRFGVGFFDMNTPDLLGTGVNYRALSSQNRGTLLVTSLR